MPYKDKEMARLNKQKFYQNNKERIKARTYQYKERIIKTLHGRFKQVKRSALQAGRTFIFTEPDYEKFFYKQPCFYCGEESTGIDRVDSSKDYLMDNCIPCCIKCNRMKMDKTFEEFIDQINKIYCHLSNK